MSLQSQSCQCWLACAAVCQHPSVKGWHVPSSAGATGTVSCNTVKAILSPSSCSNNLPMPVTVVVTTLAEISSAAQNVGKGWWRLLFFFPTGRKMAGFRAFTRRGGAVLLLSCCLQAGTSSHLNVMPHCSVMLSCQPCPWCAHFLTGCRDFWGLWKESHKHTLHEHTITHTLNNFKY